MYLPCLFSIGVSTASLVVPAILLTIFLFEPIILFIKDDFPTFGLPINAIFILSSSFSSTCFSGKSFTISSNISPKSCCICCRNWKWIISEEYKIHKNLDLFLRSLSHLFTAKTIFFLAFFSFFNISRSSF